MECGSSPNCEVPWPGRLENPFIDSQEGETPRGVPVGEEALDEDPVGVPEVLTDRSF